MSVPKQRKTKSQRRIKENSFKIKKQKFSKCSKCNQPVRSHHACSNCGTYNKKKVVEKKQNKKRKKDDKKSSSTKK